MIVILLFIGAVLFATTMIFMQPSFKKNCWVAVGLVLTLGSIGLIVLNYHNHFGDNGSENHDYLSPHLQ